MAINNATILPNKILLDFFSVAKLLFTFLFSVIINRQFGGILSFITKKKGF